MSHYTGFSHHMLIIRRRVLIIYTPLLNSNTDTLLHTGPALYEYYLSLQNVFAWPSVSFVSFLQNISLYLSGFEE